MIKDFFYKLKNEHKFLFSALVISAVLSIASCIYCLIYLYTDKYYGFIFLIPTLVMLFINYIAIYLYKYIPKLTKFITFILNIFIIVIVQILIGMFLLCLTEFINWDYIHDKPQYYQKVLSDYPKERIAHFPNEIPKEAKNVEMNADIFSFFGGQTIVLKFDIDRQYIENELKKYKFKSKENFYHYVFSAMITGDNIKINKDDYTLYVISGDFDRFGKNYGIGVNKDFNQIIYYYSNPD